MAPIKIHTPNGIVVRTLESLRALLKGAKSEEQVLELFGSKIEVSSADSREIGELLNSRLRDVRKLKQIEEQVLSARTQEEVRAIVDNSGLSIEDKSSIADVINYRLSQLRGATSAMAHTPIRNLEQVRTKMSSLFMSNLTPQEANEMALKYKEIFAEPDNMKFTEKLVNQMIVDFGFELHEIPAKYSKIPMSGCTAAFSISKGLELNENLLATLSNMDSRKRLFSSVAHELKHAQQYKIACQADFVAFVNAETQYAMFNGSTDDALANALRENNDDVVALLQSVRAQIRNSMLPVYKQQPQLSKTSPLYQKGLAYIDSRENYKLPHMFGFDSLTPEEQRAVLRQYRYGQLLEREGYETGETAEEVYNLIAA